MEFLIIFLLTVVNGVLAMSEIAVVSARKARLQHQAEDGKPGAQIALDLANNPNRFLSTVQIGISLVGIGAGAFGGATVAGDIGDLLARVEPLQPYSRALGVAVVVAITTYLSLIIGELVPKRLAIRNPERVARLVAPAMRWLSVAAYPLVWFLSISTNAVLWLLGVRDTGEPLVTEGEISTMLREGAQAGVFEPDEPLMVEGVFRLDDLRAESVMTPRTEMVWFEVNDTPDILRQKIMSSDHARYPVCEESVDKVLGMVHTKDLLRRSLIGGSLDLRALVRPIPFIPQATSASDVLNALRGDGEQMAIIIDEHGGVEGLVTVNDLVEAVVGDIEKPDAIRRDDGSWLIDGLMPVEEFKSLVGIKTLPAEDEDVYRTLAGMIINQIGRIPQISDHFEWGGYRFEVVDMDGNRVDRVLVQPIELDSEADDVEDDNGSALV